LKRITGIVALAAALAIPVAAAADQPTSTDKSNAAKECKALRTASGTANFNTMFGKNSKDKNAYGKCVSTKTRQEAAQRQAANSNAAKQCKSEQAQTDDTFMAAHEGKTFAQTYGAKNAKSAYGKCVSTKAKQNKAAADQKDKDTVSAAKFCKGQQSTDAATFKTTYKNFGQCVSKKAHELNAQRQQQQQQQQQTQS
jgi:hypothetical protein